MTSNTNINQAPIEGAFNDPLDIVDPVDIAQNEHITQIIDNDNNIDIEDDPLAVDNTSTILLEEENKLDDLTTGKIIIVDVNQLKKGKNHNEYFK